MEIIQFPNTTYNLGPLRMLISMYFLKTGSSQINIYGHPIYILHNKCISCAENDTVKE